MDTTHKEETEFPKISRRRRNIENQQLPEILSNEQTENNALIREAESEHFLKPLAPVLDSYLQALAQKPRLRELLQMKG